MCPTATKGISQLLNSAGEIPAKNQILLNLQSAVTDPQLCRKSPCIQIPLKTPGTQQSEWFWNDELFCLPLPRKAITPTLRVASDCACGWSSENLGQGLRSHSHSESKQALRKLGGLPLPWPSLGSWWLQGFIVNFTLSLHSLEVTLVREQRAGHSRFFHLHQNSTGTEKTLGQKGQCSPPQKKVTVGETAQWPSQEHQWEASVSGHNSHHRYQGLCPHTRTFGCCHWLVQEPHMS